jgi:hypothetical protein
VTEQKRLKTFLPGFGGFHGTRWKNLFPFSREMRADRFALEEGDAGLDAAEFSEILREASDGSRFFTSLATRFCRRYDAETSRWLGFELGLTFSGLDIPVVAGGTTDFILATMPVNGARKLFACSAEEGHQRLVDSIRDRFAPHDGVVPYPEMPWSSGSPNPSNAGGGSNSATCSPASSIPGSRSGCTPR